MATHDLTSERLREKISYDPDTGEFRHKIAHGSAVAGGLCGRVNRDGYRQISVDLRLYSAHRLAWLYVYGMWPDGFIDHINRLRDDNRIKNLRVVSRAENNQNTKLFRTNTSGYRGVTWDSRGKKWRASITVNNKKRSLGSHNTKLLAYEAYLFAASSLHSANSAVAEHLQSGIIDTAQAEGAYPLACESRTSGQP